MKYLSAWRAALSLLVISANALAQEQPPFLGPGGPFDPEISVIQSGALLDAQVVVSEDRRYVTINTRTTLSRLQSLQVFPVPGGLGFVGMGGGGGATVGGALKTSPSQIAQIDLTAANSVLRKEGMFLLRAIK